MATENVPGASAPDAVVTIARADFDQIVEAMHTAVAAQVAIQALVNHEAMESGIGFALESVLKRQEESVCNVADMLHDKYINQGAAA